MSRQVISTFAIGLPERESTTRPLIKPCVLCGWQGEKPAAFEDRGKVVCLIEEMKEKYKAEAAPAHEHLVGFRVEDKTAARFLPLILLSITNGRSWTKLTSFLSTRLALDTAGLSSPTTQRSSGGCKKMLNAWRSSSGST